MPPMGSPASGLPCIPASPKLRAKSSSFASLMCHHVPDESTHALPAASNSRNIMPVLYVHTENEPVYAPTHPLNHPENEAIFNKHPPVIYPPPDLVPASNFRPRSPINLIQNSNPPMPNLMRHSSTSIGSPGLSSASSSGFETARSSSSSMSSIMFENQNYSPSGNGLINSQVLEIIKEASPPTMTNSSRV